MPCRKQTQGGLSININTPEYLCTSTYVYFCSRNFVCTSKYLVGHVFHRTRVGPAPALALQFALLSLLAARFSLHASRTGSNRKKAGMQYLRYRLTSFVTGWLEGGATTAEAAESSRVGSTCNCSVLACVGVLYELACLIEPH